MILELTEFSTRAGEWLSGEGPHCDIVTSSRIRLARITVVIGEPIHLKPDELKSLSNKEGYEQVTERIMSSIKALELP